MIFIGFVTAILLLLSSCDVTTETVTETKNDKQILQKNSDWAPVKRRDSKGILMVKVPQGSFQMGGSSQSRQLSSSPVHTQIIDNEFWIDYTEVTVADYEECVSARSCTAISSEYGERPFMTGNHPITWTTWYEAATYCHWRGGQLPSETEWEYAAVGVSNYIVPWGNDGANGNLEFAFSVGLNSGDPIALPTTVGLYPKGASWVGALDMLGNVWEWTRSVEASYPFTNSNNRDYVADSNSIPEKMIVRGPSSGFEDSSQFSNSKTRAGLDSNLSDDSDEAVISIDFFDDLGFRCVKEQL